MTPSPESRYGRTPGRLLVPAVGLLFAMAGAGLGTVLPGTAGAQTLRGSQASLDRQNQQALAHDYTFLRTASQVGSFVSSGYLVEVAPAGFQLKDVSFPYARAEVGVFVARLASQYRAACGETLVVTSLTRPLSQQPRNASDRSVHPTGMAVDLRRSTNSRCRSWLESTLLSLEGQGVLEATYETSPPHYHIAIFPEPYGRYVEARTGAPVVVASAPSASPSGAAPALSYASHRVRWGETLLEIALEYGTTLTRLKTENGLTGDLVREGQTLRIPVAGSSSGRGPVVTVASSSPVVAVAAPPPGASAIPESPAPAEPTRHRVRAGESLWEIARMYGITEDVLRVANGMSGSRILVGQNLLVPGGSAGDGVVQYKVRNGDSLSVIALRLGTTVRRIQETNDLDNTRIYAGQILDVPVTR